MKRLVALFFLVSHLVSGQDSTQTNYSFNGYLTEMASGMTESVTKEWIIDNQLHNRLNFKWFNNANTFTAAFELRNRFMLGESVETIPNYAEDFGSDDGLFDLSYNLATGNNYVVNSKIDRAYIDYTKEKFQLRVGRQRINWGQCFVWNPNDLFNAYSFFDFDYVEKPGADAIRLHYYPSTTSTIELATKVNGNEEVTSALLYRFNRYNYDIQLLGGVLNSSDYMVGAGWSGNIKSASFMGEISYFRPIDNFADTASTLVLSLGSQYVFTNSMTLQVEFLYNQNPEPSGSFANFYTGKQSPKNLSISTTSFFLQGSYPATPLLNLALATMYYPQIESYFIGPSVSYSLGENLEASVYTQTFVSNTIPSMEVIYNLVFGRIKWNF